MVFCKANKGKKQGIAQLHHIPTTMIITQKVYLSNIRGGKFEDNKKDQSSHRRSIFVIAFSFML
jgi:hypothetical protein